MSEKFIGDLLVSMADRFNSADLAYIKQKLMIVMGHYTITEECTDIAPLGTIPECVKVYLVTRKIEGLADGSIKQYGSRLNDFFRSMYKPIEQIDANDIRLYLFNYQKRTGISDRTLESIRGNICTFFRWAAAEKYIPADPGILVKKIKYEKKQRGFLTELEIEMLRDACKTLRDKAMLEIFYSTACRVSEIEHLNISDVDLNSMEIVVRGKGNKQRRVYINAKCKVALKRYIDSRTDSSPALFVSSRKPYNRLTVKWIEKIFHKLGVQAGITKDVHPHLIRHTTSTHAISRGMSIENVKEMLGHVSLDTTMIYVDIANSAVKEQHHKCIV